MECYFQSCWADLGYAYTKSGHVCLLERVIWQSSKCNSVEDGVIMSSVVSLAENK
jgi:hypothetical protein